MDAHVTFRFLVELAALKDETRSEPNTPAYGRMTFSCGITAESGRVAMDITGKDSLWETPIWWFKDNTQHPAIRHPPLARRQQMSPLTPGMEVLAIIRMQKEHPARSGVVFRIPCTTMHSGP